MILASYEVEAIILGVRSFGESDKILTVLSLQEGKFDVIVKGARQPKNKNTAFAHQFFHVKMSVYRGKSIDTMSQGEIICTHPEIFSDVYKMANATYAAEMIKHVAPERESNEIIFKLLVRTLEEYTIVENPEVVTLALAMKLMALSGFKPELTKCISCGKNGDQCRVFSADRGGLLCDDCRRNYSFLKSISLNTRMTVLRLLGQDYMMLRNLRENTEFNLDEVEDIVNSYVDAKVDRTLKSRDFIYEIRQLERNNSE